MHQLVLTKHHQVSVQDQELSLGLPPPSLSRLITPWQPAWNPQVGQLEPVHMQIAGHGAPPGGHTPLTCLRVCCVGSEGVRPVHEYIWGQIYLSCILHHFVFVWLYQDMCVCVCVSVQCLYLSVYATLSVPSRARAVGLHCAACALYPFCAMECLCLPYSMCPMSMPHCVSASCWVSMLPCAYTVA